MQLVRTIAAVLFSLSSIAASADPVCLRNASNQELLNELGFRLMGGNGGGSNQPSLGTFLCDGNANVQISIIAPTGQESVHRVYSGNWDTCRSTAALLSQTRATISQLSIIAVCDGSANVQRFSVTQNGQVTQLGTLSLGNWDTCKATADQLNR